MASKVTHEELKAIFKSLGLVGESGDVWLQGPYSGAEKSAAFETALDGVDLEDIETEVTKETKEVYDTIRDCEALTQYYSGYSYQRKTRPEATILGKVNAIAEYLGVNFEVQPEKVVTSPVKVKAAKKTTKKATSKVTAKKGKK